MRRRWDPNPARRPLYAWVDTIDAWKNRRGHRADRGRHRRGIGLSFVAWFALAEPKSSLLMSTGPDGLVASSATQDMGNGTRSVIAQVVARELGISPHDVEVRIGDSNAVHGPQSSGSRTTSSIVPACVDACEQLKEELLDIARRSRSLRGARATREGVQHEHGKLGWLELMRAAPALTVVGRRRRDTGGFVLPPIMDVAIERYVVSGIQLVEVEVDTRLGHVRAVEAWGGFACGRIVAPTLARSQARGGMLQGISYTLYEERRLDPNEGFLLTGGLEDYRILGIADAPTLHVHFDESGYDRVPERSVGLAEICTLGPPAAIENAIFHATGWRQNELPIRPDRVLRGVRG